MYLRQGESLMICVCPKCAAKVDVDISQIPESGTATKCAECKTRFLIIRESIARRAYRRPAEAHCTQCGNELGEQLHCPSCGLLYPDYFVAETSEAVRKRARKSRGAFSGIRNISFEWGSRSGTKPSYTPKVKVSTAAKSQAKGTRNLIKPIVGLLLAIALIAGGVSYYKQHKSKSQYAENYVMALYALKTGTELNVKTCARLSADLKAGRSARITPEDELKMNKVKAEIDAIMIKLNEPPGDYVSAKEKLGKLYSIYKNVHSLAIAPSGSLAGLTDSASKAEIEFKQSSQDLKSSLGEDLTEALNKGKAKYKGLRDF